MYHWQLLEMPDYNMKRRFSDHHRGTMRYDLLYVEYYEDHYQ